jgi:hypothetical protein
MRRARRDDFRRMAEMVDSLAARFPQQVTAYCIVAPEAQPHDLERFPLLTDSEGAFRAAYGASRPALYLVRPDGHVAYRASPVRREALERYLGRILVPATA